MSKKKYNTITTAEERTIADMYKQGYPEGELAKKYHISHWKVYNCLDKYGVPRRFKKESIRNDVFSKLSKEDVINILKDVDEGRLSNEAIMVKYDLRTEHTLREIKAKRTFTNRKKEKDLSGLDNVDYDN